MKFSNPMQRIALMGAMGKASRIKERLISLLLYVLLFFFSLAILTLVFSFFQH